MMQNSIQITYNTIADIFTFETQENIISTYVVEWGRGGSFVGQESHHDFIYLFIFFFLINSHHDLDIEMVEKI
jgi:hypothetical protein